MSRVLDTSQHGYKKFLDTPSSSENWYHMFKFMLLLSPLGIGCGPLFD